jgi:hypothetical protein
MLSSGMISTQFRREINRPVGCPVAVRPVSLMPAGDVRKTMELLSTKVLPHL